MERLQHPTITINEAMERENVTFIDVRSPLEFEEYHLPNAINLPIFDNEERARIGTLYKQVSREAAKEQGLAIFARKLPGFYKHLAALHMKDPSHKLVVYCWRGGMRSKTLAVTMQMMEIPLIQLEGGIRSYRHSVVQKLETFSKQRKPFVVLEGNTGTRKTDILLKLKDEGYPVLDLEGLAQHRGSIFGRIGLSPVSQKEFDARIAAALEEVKGAPYLIIEGESKRIGRVILPDFLLEGKEAGTRIHVEMPFQTRVANILETYQFHNYHEEFTEAIHKLTKRLRPDVAKMVLDLLPTKQYEQMISLLLEHYYDPRYVHALSRYESDAQAVYFETFSEGVTHVKEAIEQFEEMRGFTGRKIT